MSNYFEELPVGYEDVYSIDAKQTKTGIIFTLLSFVLMVAVGAPLLMFVVDLSEITSGEALDYYMPVTVCFIVALFLYIILHELVHGLFFKIYTKAKLTFGISWSCAFCGVPQLYVKKWPMVVTSLAPFVIFNILFLVPIFLVQNTLIATYLIVLFAIHFGGCVGDLFVSILLIFKYKGNDVLVNDTGAKQTIYIKKN